MGDTNSPLSALRSQSASHFLSDTPTQSLLRLLFSLFVLSSSFSTFSKFVRNDEIVSLGGRLDDGVESRRRQTRFRIHLRRVERSHRRGEERNRRAATRSGGEERRGNSSEATRRGGEERSGNCSEAT